MNTKTMRPINKIIVHCTATPPSMDPSAAIIRSWHKQQGFYDIGYHYIVHRDGTIEEGRPVDKIGAHCSGHNIGSIGIAYTGGINEQGEPEDNRTPKQATALRELVYNLSEYYNATIHGHNEFNPNKYCPCFQCPTDL